MKNYLKNIVIFVLSIAAIGVMSGREVYVVPPAIDFPTTKQRLIKNNVIAKDGTQQYYIPQSAGGYTWKFKNKNT